jgi:hypothetical protein
MVSAFGSDAEHKSPPSTLAEKAANGESLFGPYPSAARAASASARFFSTMLTERMDAS